MKRNYIFAISLAVIMGLIVAILPERELVEEISPDEMLTEILDETRFYTADEVANFIISEDPSVLLIDVRNPEEYAEFSLPGAINIPLDSILSESYEYIVNNDSYTNIFFSNGTIYANQAWMLTRRLNYKSNYVLKGGLNNWFETIIKPTKPQTTDSQQEFDLYEFRKAALQFFTGGGEIIETQTPAVNVEIRKVEKEETGGC